MDHNNQIHMINIQVVFSGRPWEERFSKTSMVPLSHVVINVQFSYKKENNETNEKKYESFYIFIVRNTDLFYLPYYFTSYKRNIH